MNNSDRLTQIMNIPPIYWQLKACFANNFFALKDVFTERWYVVLQDDGVVTATVCDYLILSDACSKLLCDIPENSRQKQRWDNYEAKADFF